MLRTRDFGAPSMPAPLSRSSRPSRTLDRFRAKGLMSVKQPDTIIRRPFRFVFGFFGGGGWLAGGGAGVRFTSVGAKGRWPVWSAVLSWLCPLRPFLAVGPFGAPPGSPGRGNGDPGPSRSCRTLPLFPLFSWALPLVRAFRHWRRVGQKRLFTNNPTPISSRGDSVSVAVGGGVG